MRAILRSRISIANKFVRRIYLDEYKVLDHLVNLQRVFFFGAGDLMHTFYSKLFKSVSILNQLIALIHIISITIIFHVSIQMNSNEDWNNAYLLTVQLNEVLTTRYPNLNSMFSVEITAADSHIKDVCRKYRTSYLFHVFFLG